MAAADRFDILIVYKYLKGSDVSSELTFGKGILKAWHRFIFRLKGWRDKARFNLMKSRVWRAVFRAGIFCLCLLYVRQWENYIDVFISIS